MKFIQPFFFARKKTRKKPSYLLELKKLFQYLHRLLRVRNRVSDRARILEDLIVVAALVCLVAEEMDFRVFDTRDVFLLGQVLEAVGLVPAGREDVERDLSANGVSDGGKEKVC